MIYLDNAATTYPKPEIVYEAVNYATRNLAFNAGRGGYEEARTASKVINDARVSVASLVKTRSENVVFTSSATESLNLIINGLSIENGDVVYISPFEHNAIVRPLYLLKEKVDFQIEILPFDNKNWEPEINKISDMFSFKKPKAVFISQISNVTGLLLDYEKIFELSKRFGAINILDSAQSLGEVNPNIENCDYCVFAGHKTLYSIFGIAGFIICSNHKLTLTKSGGNGSDSLNHYMPSNGYARYESGSPNVIAIYTLWKSIDWLKDNYDCEMERKLTNYLIEKIGRLPKVKLFLPENKNVFGIVSFAVEGYTSDDVASILSEEFDIKVRSGFHCSPFVHSFIGSEDYKGTVRISLGAFNTSEDIDKLYDALLTLWGEGNESVKFDN